MFKYFLLSFFLLQINVAVAVEDIWDKASEISGIPKQKIYSMAIQESGIKMSDSKMRPWPWTINSPRGSMRFASKAEAYAAIKKLVDDGVTNVDIGIMQINLRWNWSLIRDRDILDPKVNILTAAELLKTGMVRTNGNIRKAVAFYHSSRTNEANSYDAAVLKYEPAVFAAFSGKNQVVDKKFD
jgi:hypothetical protein